MLNTMQSFSWAFSTVRRITFLCLLPSLAVAGELPFKKTASFVTDTQLPMNVGSMRSETFIKKQGDSYIVGEWLTENNRFSGNKKTFNLTMDGYVHSVDLDSMECTKTDVSEVQGAFDDPAKAYEFMKTSMGLKEAGNCEGGGYKGKLLQSSMMKLCSLNGFTLWTEGMGARTESQDIKFDKSFDSSKISLPKGVECKKGPSVADIMGSMQTGAVQGASASSSAGAQASDRSERSNQQPMTQEDAMKAAQEALKGLEGLFGK